MNKRAPLKAFQEKMHNEEEINRTSRLSKKKKINYPKLRKET